MARRVWALLLGLGLAFLLLSAALLFPSLLHADVVPLDPLQRAVPNPMPRGPQDEANAMPSSALAGLPPEAETPLPPAATDRPNSLASPIPAILSSSSPTRLPDSVQLAMLALQYLTANTTVLRRADYPSSLTFKVVVDYTAHPAMDYAAFVRAYPGDWAFVTAFVPAVDPLHLHRASLVTHNQLVWGPPTELNVHTLWSSMNLFDAQLLLRPGDLAARMTGLDLKAVVANTLPLARTTLLLLPCDIPDEVAFVHQALEWLRNQSYQLGCRHIEADVLEVGPISSATCARRLLEVRLRRLVKGTRHTWCYYTHASRSDGAWTKFVLHYTAGASPPLRVQRDANATEAAGWTAAKVIPNWLPNINLGDVLGWGVTAPQRLLLYWSMLREPYWTDYNTHNWVVSGRGQVFRIDNKEIKSSKKHPPGLKYVRRLRADACLPAALLPPERACGPCKSCIDHAETAYRIKVHPLRECRLCLPCLEKAVFDWAPARGVALPYPMGTGWANLTRDSWGHPSPCLTFVPRRERVDVQMCGLGRTRPAFTARANSTAVQPPAD
eukprot:EG_transcript_8162